MTKTIRKTILAALAAVTLAATLQPAHAGGGFDLKPGIGKPIHPGPGWKKPGWKKPGHPHHHHGKGEAAALGLIGGMIIGSALANSQPRTVYVDGGSAHVEWCLNRYRSYDIGTDTYMSHSGYRKYCNSPYN